MHRDGLLVVLLLLLPLLLHRSFSIAAKNIQCTTSCGEIANIRYPFWVRGDPEGCGDHNYELACIHNRTILDWNSGQFYVRSISYTNHAIWVVDVESQKRSCSFLPRRSLPNGDQDVYTPQGNDMAIVGCTKAVDSLLYIDASSCLDELQFSNFSSTKRRIYAMINAQASSVETGCTIEFMARIPLMADVDGLRSYAQINERMADGFELRWFTQTPLSVKDSILLYLFDFTEAICWASSLGIGITCRMFNLSCQVWVELCPNPLFSLYWIVLQCIVVKLLLGAPCITIFLVRKWRRRHLAMDQNVEDFLQSNNNFLPIRYSYSDIKKITGGFKDKLGEGGFGFVFRGRLRSGRDVAIKILKKGKTNGQDFINEVATIGRIHHTNVVGLVGYCFEGSKQALVYDFMHNGSLDRHIFSRTEGTSLDCKEIYEIALRISKGIEYLHRGCDIQILHFDIKPHNILLDKDFNPKISDFGLAKLYPTDYNTVSVTAARGTLGYMAPELVYRDLGGVSYKADVYSFGKLLMEMASERKNLEAYAENSSQVYFPLWIHDQLNEGLDILMEIVSEDDRRRKKKMIIVALWCIQLNPCDRPSMRKVLEMLEREVEYLQIPPKPLFYPSAISTRDDGTWTDKGNDTISASSTSATTYEDSHLEVVSIDIAQA